MEQWRIQAWIERIPRSIQKVIDFEGGNEYREGGGETTQITTSRELARQRR
jgi:hypothetical protein